MTHGNPLCNGLLIRKSTMGTGPVLSNKRVIFIWLYLGEGKSQGDATNGSWKCFLCSTNRDGSSHVAISQAELHSGMCALVGFSPYNTIHLKHCSALPPPPPGMIRGVIIKLPHTCDVTWKIVYCGHLQFHWVKTWLICFSYIRE